MDRLFCCFMIRFLIDCNPQYNCRMKWYLSAICIALGNTFLISFRYGSHKSEMTIRTCCLSVSGIRIKYSSKLCFRRFGNTSISSPLIGSTIKNAYFPSPLLRFLNSSIDRISGSVFLFGLMWFVMCRCTVVLDMFNRLPICVNDCSCGYSWKISFLVWLEILWCFSTKLLSSGNLFPHFRHTYRRLL